MDSETENLQFIKKHNRKIVNRAFNQSITNAKYVFPKKNVAQQTESDIHDIISLRSRVSQRYNLYHQNAIQECQEQKLRTIVPISELLKQKIHKKTAQKMRARQNEDITFNHQKVKQQQKRTKRKYLSLSAKKTDFITFGNPKNLQKSCGIKLTGLSNQKDSQKRNLLKKSKSKSLLKNQVQNFTTNIFNSLRYLTERCLSSDNKNLRRKQQNELIFYNSKMDFSKQKFQDSKNLPSSQRTTDTTPKISKMDQFNYTKLRKGFIRFNHHLNVNTSSFNYE